MLKNIFMLITLLFFTNLHSQNWQWIKRGGSTNTLSTNARQEEVFSIVTDSDQNIYTLSAVGIASLDIDGNPKENYGDYTTIIDYALSSFSCDGIYRWSKIIGGIERIHDLFIDEENNVYVAGKFATCGNNTEYPPRIEDDVILDQSTMDCSIMFLTKFDSNGNMEWFKRPLEPGTSVEIGYSGTSSQGLSVDSEGNSYWLVMLLPGTYADGEFVNTMEGNNWFILKYDSQGEYMDAQYLNFDVMYGFHRNLQFYRNPNNGNYYILSRKGYGPNDSASVNGEEITNSVFMASFDSQGMFQWKRENTYEDPGSLHIYNLDFDNENNIYLGGGMLGLNLDSFLGFSIPESIVPGFIMKTDPTAENVLWASYNNKGAEVFGAIRLNGDEVAFTSYCAGTDFSWGDQTLNASDINNNEGTEVLFARFDKETGACIALDKINGDVGYYDRGTAIAVDAAGDYLVGGGFGHYLYDAYGGEVFNSGPQSDFFIAKYATSVCNTASIGNHEMEGIKIYPNPVKDLLTISAISNLDYILYGMTGTVVGTGIILPSENTISTEHLAAGIYLLELKDMHGNIQLKKVVKQ